MPGEGIIIILRAKTLQVAEKKTVERRTSKETDRLVFMGCWEDYDDAYGNANEKILFFKTKLEKPEGLTVTVGGMKDKNEDVTFLQTICFLRYDISYLDYVSSKVSLDLDSLSQYHFLPRGMLTFQVCF